MPNTFLNNLLVELVRGDDYLAADGRAVVIVGTGVAWPASLVSIKLVLTDPGCCVTDDSPLEIAGTFEPATSSAAAKASFDVPRAVTLTLKTGVRRYCFEVRAVLASTSVVTLGRGLLSVMGGAR